MRRLRKRILSVCGAAAATVVLAAGLAGCSSSAVDPLTDLHDTSGGVAATVNGVEVGENVVTAYIEQWRADQGLEDDDSWADWLINAGYESIEDLRDVIVDYYAYLELVSQAGDECGATVDDAEVDAQMDAIRAQYDTDEEWEQALAQAGTTEGLWRYIVRLSLLQEASMEQLYEAGELGDVDATDDDVLYYVQSYGMADGAKRSSHILFDADDEETAQQVLDQINDGTLSFEEAAQEYSIDSSGADGGDVGYDNVNTFVDEYQEALDELGEGEVSGLVTSTDGIHIIMCTEVIDPVEDDIVSLEQLPDDYVDYWRDYVTTSNEQSAFSSWMSDYKANSTIEYTDMPEGLSYYIDLTLYADDDTEDEATVSAGSIELLEDESDGDDSTEADEGDEAAE